MLAIIALIALGLLQLAPEYEQSSSVEPADEFTTNFKKMMNNWQTDGKCTEICAEMQRLQAAQDDDAVNVVLERMMVDNPKSLSASERLTLQKPERNSTMR